MDSLSARLRRSLVDRALSAIRTEAAAHRRRPREQTLLWLAAALVVAAPALALTIAVERSGSSLPGEAELTQRVQDWPFPNERASDVVRALTTTQVVMAVGGVAAVALWVRGRRREAVSVALAVAVLPLAQAAIKQIVDRPRPPPDVVEIRGGFTSPSFPAGHVMSPTAIYGLFLFLAFAAQWRAPARLAVAATAVPLLVLTGPVNVWLGVHWPSDVAGGYLWGLLLVVIFAWLATPPLSEDSARASQRARTRPTRRRRRRRPIGTRRADSS